MRMQWRVWTFLGVVLAAVVAVGLIVGPIITAKPQVVTSDPGQDPFAGVVGVVNFDELIGKYQDSKRIQEIDAMLTSLSAELESGPNPSAYGAEVEKAIRRAQATLMVQFKADVNRVQAQMDARKASVEGQLKGEADRLQAELQAYRIQLQKQHPELFQASAPSIGAGQKKQAQNIILARDVNLARRRVELQREMDQKLAGEKRALDDELTAKMADAIKANQAEKIQIQLDLQTATDEEQRKKLQDRLQALTDAEDAKRGELRKELGARYEGIRQKELSRAGVEMRQYQAKLDAEVREQLARLSGGGSGAPANVAEINRLLNAKQAELKARFEARKDALMGELRRESDAAQAYLKGRQADLEQRLRAEQKKIIEKIIATNKRWQADELKRRARLEKEVAELKEQRERTYDAIVEQIRTDVAALAKENNVPLVLGGYRVNIKCQDMTQLVIDRLAKK